MLDTIMLTLKTMGWLGIIFGILVMVNTICGTVTNIYHGENFSWKKMLKGLGKALIFYASSVATAVAFTILPFVNTMITDTFGKVLIETDMLETLSCVGVLGICIAAIVAQGKKALESITALSGIKSEKEEITWEVEEDEQ
jgi:hypothetical protein